MYMQFAEYVAARERLIADIRATGEIRPITMSHSGNVYKPTNEWIGKYIAYYMHGKRNTLQQKPGNTVIISIYLKFLLFCSETPTDIQLDGVDRHCPLHQLHDEYKNSSVSGCHLRATSIS